MLNSITADSIYQRYARGKDYLDRLKLVKEMNEAYRFYEGDQWQGFKDGGMRMPIDDVIVPIVDYKVAVVTQNLMEIVYSGMNYTDPAFMDETKPVIENLNEHAAKLWENMNMDTICYNIVKDACIARGKYIMFYIDRGDAVIANGQSTYPDMKIQFDLLDSSNIMFDDEQERDLQRQPGMTIPLRKRVSDVREKAKANGLKDADIKRILADDNKELQAGDRAQIEVTSKSDATGEEGKVDCYLRLWKDKTTKTVHMAESTQFVVYGPEQDLGLKLYPITGMVWKDVKGTCRGQGEVNRLVPNQININTILGYRVINTKMTAFAKFVYNSDVIKNAADVVKVGAAIEVKGKGIDDVMKAAGYLQPAQFNSEPQTIQEYLAESTKSNASASPAALGNVDKPDNYRAILTVVEQAKASLNMQEVRYKQMIEDIARIWFDMWANYYTDGLPVIVTEKRETVENGMKSIQEVDVMKVVPYDVLQKLKVHTKVDISPNSPYSKYAEQLRIDNLLGNGLISLEEAAELMPDNDPMKVKLKRLIEARKLIEQMKANLEYLMMENDELRAQIQGQDEVLQEAGAAIQNTAQNGADEANKAYDKGQMDAILKLRGQNNG